MFLNHLFWVLYKFFKNIFTFNIFLHILHRILELIMTFGYVYIMSFHDIHSILYLLLIFPFPCPSYQKREGRNDVTIISKIKRKNSTKTIFSMWKKTGDICVSDSGLFYLTFSANEIIVSFFLYYWPKLYCVYKSCIYPFAHWTFKMIS